MRPLILAYHTVSSTWASPLAIDEASFEAQLAYLRERGYVGFTLTEAERRRRAGRLPPRALVVTFDDGYASTLNAKATLDRLGYPATVFVVTGFVDSGEPLTWYGVEDHGDAAERRCLSWRELRALHADGWEIGSHTVTHPLLTRLDESELTAELTRSRRRLAEQLGSCTAIAYPYGQADGRVADRARNVGYEVGCTLTGAHLADATLLRPRIGLTPGDRGARLAAKVSRPGVALRRSPAARLARRLRRRRPWLPGGEVV